MCSAALTRNVKSLNHKIDKVSADATAVTSHEEAEWCLWCLPHCFAIAYIVQSNPFKFVPVHMAYGGVGV